MSGRRGLFLTAVGWLISAMSLGGVLLATPDEAAAIKLNPSLVAGGAVLDAQLTPDGSRVVYLADQEINGVAELYSVSVNGGVATKLNEPLVPGGAVKGFSITPNGSRVVFLADQDVNDVVEIYSVPIAGGTVTRLNDPPISHVGGNVTSFLLTPDGSRVVYLADQDTADHFELFGVPVAGGATTHEAEGPTSSWAARCSHSRSRPDGTRVVFRGDLETNELIELYSVADDRWIDHEAQSRAADKRMSSASRSPRAAPMWCIGRRRTTKTSSSSTSSRSRAARSTKLNGPLPPDFAGQLISVHARWQPGRVSRSARDRAVAAGTRRSSPSRSTAWR